MAEARKTTTAKAQDTKPAKATAKSTNNFPWKVIIGIIVAAVIIAGAIFCIIQLTGNKDDEGKKEDDKTETAQVLENGKGNKIDAKYVSLDGFNYKLLAPAEFTTMSAEQIAEDYGTSDAPDLVLTNKDNTVNLALSKPENALSNEQIETYLDAMEQVFDAAEAKDIKTRSYEVNGHKVGEIKMVTDYTDEDIFNHMIFFSYDGKLAVISFNCLDDMRGEWGKVGEEIMKSLVINQ